MDLSKLPKLTRRSQKRVGRGIGSGKGGHTSGRGQKGQKSRGDIPIIFEGTKIKKSFIKRLPLMRGRGKLKPQGEKATVINLSNLENWPKATPVTTENLVKNGLLSDGEAVKILGKGEVKQELDIRVEISKPAKEKVIAAGGKIMES